MTYFGNQLIAVNTTTGVGSLIGPLSTPMSPLRPGVGRQQPLHVRLDRRRSRRINTATGATQATFNIGLRPGALLGQGGLAFQNGSVGFLTSALDPSTLTNANDLYRFDIGTGKSTLIAHTAVALEAIAFNAGGVLYGLGKADGLGGDGNLYTINTANGTMTLVGNVGVPIGSPTGGLWFGANGTLYATLDDALLPSTPRPAWPPR